MLRTLDTSIAKMEYRTAWVIAPSNGLPIVVDYDPVAIRVRGVGALPLIGPRRPLASVLTAVCTFSPSVGALGCSHSLAFRIR
jgi:hypothetical protein